MKKVIVCIISVIVMTASATFLCGCSEGGSAEEAKTQIKEFLAAVEAEDYDSARTYLHPERTEIDPEEFFKTVKESKGVDFKSGIEVEKVNGVSMLFYDSEVGGSKCSYELDVKVGEQTLQMSFDVVRNGVGFGIYNFSVEKSVELTFHM